MTDIHRGPDMGTTFGTAAPRELARFCDAMRAFRPDITVNLGDRINDTDPAHDQAAAVFVQAGHAAREPGEPCA